MSKYGQAFIDRESHGVSGLTKINTDDVKKIPIVLVNDKIQNDIEVKYRSMSTYHYKAMKVKQRKVEEEYKDNLEISKKMLKDLIKITEEIIEGKRDDVN